MVTGFGIHLDGWNTALSILGRVNDGVSRSPMVTWFAQLPDVGLWVCVSVGLCVCGFACLWVCVSVDLWVAAQLVAQGVNIDVADGLVFVRGRRQWSR